MLVWLRHHHPVSFCVCGHFWVWRSVCDAQPWKKELGSVWGWLMVAHRAWRRLRRVHRPVCPLEQLAPFYHPEETWSSLVLNLAAADAWLFSIGSGVFLAVSYFFAHLFKKPPLHRSRKAMRENPRPAWKSRGRPQELLLTVSKFAVGRPSRFAQGRAGSSAAMWRTQLRRLGAPNALSWWRPFRSWGAWNSSTSSWSGA